MTLTFLIKMTEAYINRTVTISLAEYKELIQKAYEYDNKYVNLKNELKNSVNTDKKSLEDNIISMISEVKRQIENCAIEQKFLNSQFSAYNKTITKKKHWWQ